MKPLLSILLLDASQDHDLQALLGSRGYQVVPASSTSALYHDSLAKALEWARQSDCEAVLKPIEKLSSSAPACETLADCEKRHILAVLEQCGWNRTHAAAKLAISVRTLRNKLKEYREAAAVQNELIPAA
jgi:DNA-binding NtrC family response regulator